MAYALTLRDPERTLTDEDADAVMDAIARAATAAGWTIRA
jgi:phenylalanyl-tRNA synthetase beta subunit